MLATNNSPPFSELRAWLQGVLVKSRGEQAAWRRYPSGSGWLAFRLVLPERGLSLMVARNGNASGHYSLRVWRYADIRNSLEYIVSFTDAASAPNDDDLLVTSLFLAAMRCADLKLAGELADMVVDTQQGGELGSRIPAALEPAGASAAGEDDVV